MHRTDLFPLRVCIGSIAMLMAAGALLLLPHPAQAADACGVYSSAVAVPAGFGAAFNTISTAQETLLQSNCAEAGFTAEVGSAQTTAANFAVYEKGYSWNGTAWTEFALAPNGGTLTGAFVLGNARSAVTLSYSGDNSYWVSFACILQNNAWKCGCRDAACAAPFWNLQVAKRPAAGTPPAGGGSATLRPWSTNPRYWQLNDTPVLLLGGTDRDNLFQFSASALQNHINLLKSAGGNYVRNTMSDRKRPPADEYNSAWGPDVFAFQKLSSGKYDLNQWNNEYWNRFSRMLKATADNGIVVQIELWDIWDLMDRSSINAWGTHPWNSKNNVNYTTSNTKLPVAYAQSCCSKQHPFFRTIPELDNDPIVLGYQRKFIEKVLSYSLAYDHVLYQIQNESWIDVRWSTYWADLIQKEATKKGKKVNITDSRFDASVNPVINAPNLYSFADIGQSATKSGEAQMTFIRQKWEQLSSTPMPLNSIKQYGADSGNKGSTSEAIDRFMRSIFGGQAAVRFHRPEVGLGLSTTAQNVIKSVRMMENEIKLFNNVEPHSASHIRALLGSRSDNEAYIMAHPGRAYAVYFTNGGSVTLNTSAVTGSMTLKWIDVNKGSWGSTATLNGSSQTITAPGGKWIAVVNAAQ